MLLSQLNFNMITPINDKNIYNVCFWYTHICVPASTFESVHLHLLIKCKSSVWSTCGALCMQL